MNRAGVFIVAMLLNVSFAQQPAATPNGNPPRKLPERTLYGFHGAVHCALVTTQKLAADPRDQRNSRVQIGPGTPWQCFNREGWTEESGTVESGKPINVFKEQRGPNGERAGNSSSEREVKRKEGNVETKESWQGDRLIARWKTWFDEQNRPIREELEMENGGNVVSTTSYDGSAQTTDTQVFSAGKVTEHHRTTVDPQAGLVDLMRFEPEGSMIAEIRSVKDQLTYAWHIPGIKDWGDPVGTSWRDHYKGTVLFRFDRNGDVLKQVQHHVGRDNNFEPDDAEVTDMRGVVVERVEFKYERDTLGNWINRIVLVRDPNTGTMIEVEKNHRELTYY